MTLQELNWNRNPEIKKAGQRLNIFQKGPTLNQKLSRDPSNLDPALEELFKKFEIGHGPNISPSIRTKSKIVLFRYFVRPIKTEEGLEFLNDLEVLDAEIFSQSIKIKND